MTDINNNFNSDFPKIHNKIQYGNNKDVSFNGETYHQEKEIKNLDNDQAAVVGRSMIKKRKIAFSGLSAETKEGIKSSLSELKQNPELIAKSNILFDAALKKGYSYEQADAIATEFLDLYR